MYHFVKDKDYLNRMKDKCSKLINQLVQMINNGPELNVEAYLIGSGARNLITQNENEPIDLDYNLVVVSSKKEKLCDVSEEKIKNYVKKEFNIVLKRNGLEDCDDSTSCLETKKMYFFFGNPTLFSIDLAIVHENPDGTLFRLIHSKTGIVEYDEWYWNEAPHSKGLKKKVDELKKNGCWAEVRQTYLNKKNLYLSRQDENHPSFICYIEAVNEVHYKYFG